MTSGSATSALPSFLDGYAPEATVFDELYAADGAVRPEWEYLIRSLGTLGPVEFDRRCAEGRRLLHDSGVTYNAFGEGGRSELPWMLDPMPVLISSSSWRTIEVGLVQRAELLEAVLEDLYGAQRLIRSGVLPASLIYGHSGFLRPCFGMPVAGNRHLPTYSADIARTADGTFIALGDRAQAPSGTGYALQNRVVMAHVLPSIFRDSQVHRLRFYFRRLRTALLELAPDADDIPNMVLLTPGPGSETYFEHTYLANYLGCTLVQGSDLTVADQRVWLNTLDGLRRVDVILRRVDGAFCDPLELRNDSVLGTPGLLQAARAGNVAIVNPIGCSAIENPGLMAFLPVLAQQLLGQDLKMPSVRTWWCGHDEARRYVTENLQDLVIKPTNPHSSDMTVFGGQLDAEGRDRIVAKIEAAPHLFVGQEYVRLSHAPVVVGSRLEPRPMVLRSFVAADSGGYTVMPGGLCRVAPTPDSKLVSTRSGGASKDIWVLASEPERELEAITASEAPLPLRHAEIAVGRRVAENLFWVGRYSERIEKTTRALREVARLTLEGDVTDQRDPRLQCLLSVACELTATYPPFNSGQSGPIENAGVTGILADQMLIGSVRNDIGALLGASDAVRDQFSYDTWRTILSIGSQAGSLGPTLGDLAGLEDLLTLLAAFGGLCADSMTRGARRRFLETGRCLERALALNATLRRLAADPNPANRPWHEILGLADAQTAYQVRYRSTPSAESVLDLLIDDDSNPRSLVFQLIRLDSLLQGLSPRGNQPDDVAPQKILRQALAHLRKTAQPDATEPRFFDAALESNLSYVSERLAAISTQLATNYFQPIEGPTVLTPQS